MSFMPLTAVSFSVFAKAGFSAVAAAVIFSTMGVGPVSTMFARCVASQKGLEQGAKRRRGEPRQGFATPRKAFLIATRREWGEKGATRRCAPSPDESLGVVTRLDWRLSHPIRICKHSVNRP